MEMDEMPRERMVNGKRGKRRCLVGQPPDA